MSNRRIDRIRRIHLGKLPALALSAALLLAPHASIASGANSTASLISDKSLQALRQANMYGASLFHLRAPDSGFMQQMRVAIPRDYSGMDQGIRLGLAHIERDLPYPNGYFSNKNQQQLASFIATYRAKITEPQDPVEQQVRLAEVMAFTALAAYRQHHNAAPPAHAFQQEQMESLKYRQLQGGMRSYSPLCNPTRADAASNFQGCHP